MSLCIHRCLLPLAILVLLCAAPIAWAQPNTEPQEANAGNIVPALSIPRVSIYGGGFAVKVTAGWEFDVVEAVEVTELGVWNTTGTGLDKDTPVGLWGPDGKLIVSATVPKGGDSHAVDKFRYVKIEPRDLKAGGPYVIAAQYVPGTKEMVISSNHGEFVTSGAIRWRKSRRESQEEFGLPEGKTDKFSEMPGSFGPGFLVATQTRRPDVYYRVREVFPAGTFKTFAVEFNEEGTPPEERQPVVSMFAMPDGKLGQIAFNDTPLGTGDDALRKLDDTVKRLYPSGKPDRPLVSLAAMATVKESDAKAVAEAVGELFDDRHKNGGGDRTHVSSFTVLRPRQAAREGKFVSPDRFHDAGRRTVGRLARRTITRPRRMRTS
jgi:hypothetical protein